MTPKAPVLQASVVIATFNRPTLLRRLLVELARQTMDPTLYEVIVVDDGSSPPAAGGLEGLELPYSLRVIAQQNAGAAAARHQGALVARGELLVIVDDDMRVGEDFLRQHLEHHPAGSRRVVLGRIRPAPEISTMPYFERWYAWRLDRMAERERRHPGSLRGNAVYTGNVSMRRADYLAVGGFDVALKRSEDAELGLRLEEAGVTVHLAQDAVSFHGSDHTSEEVWLRRAFLYGIYDSRIAQKHPTLAHADPWRFIRKVNPLSGALAAAAAVAPGATRPVSRAALHLVRATDRAGLASLTYGGASLVYTMEYYRGVREASGSLRATVTSLARALKRKATP